MNWEQLKAIAWLRWRLSRNQFIRGGPLNAVISALRTVTLVMGAVGLGAAGVAGGWFAGAKAPPQVLLIIWDIVVGAFLLFWLSGLMVEIQRSESIDLQKLLHLPVTLEQVFVFNYVVSLLSVSVIFFLPGMLGLCVGLALGGGPILALMAPLALGFIFAVTGWSYCLRGWLAALMVNRRRRRAIVVWVTVIFVLMCQVPNLVINSPLFHSHWGPPQRFRHAPNQPGQVGFVHGNLSLPPALVEAHLALPLGWVGYGAMALRQRNPWPALGATALSWLIGALGLQQAYRLTLRFYRGQEDRARPVPVRPAPQGHAEPLRRSLVERGLPGLPDDIAALTLALFRSLTRAPELKMAFIAPIVMGVLGATMGFSRHEFHLPPALATFLATGVSAFTVFTMAPTMANTFGLDRDGFRTLVLIPTPRHHILLAKNLSFCPFVATAAVVLLGVATTVGRFPWDACLTGLVQVPTAFLLFSLLCNLAAMLAPFRMAPGSLQMKKPKPIAFLVMLLNMLVMPLVLPVLLVAPVVQYLFESRHWTPWLPVNVLAALAVLGVVAWLYRTLLPYEGRLLRRREQAILQEVTQEIE